MDHNTQAGSAVLNIDMEEGQSDASDYDNSFEESNIQPGGEGRKKGEAFIEDIRQRMSDNVTQMVWQAGSQSARRAWSLYGNIDILRPYFNVEPAEVQKRLLYSLIPMRPAAQRQQVPKELYGPTMVVLTLIALLLYQMKTAEHKVEEGTLMGSAFGICFMYWLGSSGLVWFITYVCSVRITILQILSMMGYSLFGHCIVLFLGTVVHTSHDHMFFYVLWAVIGGLSTLRMAGIIMSRVRGRAERLMVIGAIALLHMLFLLYLHFAYHTIVEELSDVFGEKLVPVPVSQVQEQGENVAGPKILTPEGFHTPIMAEELEKVPLINPASNQTHQQARLPLENNSILLGKLRNTGTILA